MTLFALTLGPLRVVTHLLAPKELGYPRALQRGGGLVFGLATGYLAAGFLLCVLQTLPWPEHVPILDAGQPGTAFRAVLPPDRAWRALLRQAGTASFASGVERAGFTLPPGSAGPRRPPGPGE
jgi:hypothetical protein